MSTKKMTVKVNPEDVTFGIEIECAVPSALIQNLACRLCYYGTELPEPFPVGWVIKTDESVGDFPQGYQPVEIVSPILNGIEGLQQIERVMEILNGMNAKVNYTCGMHVHIGMESVLGEYANDFDFIAEWVRRLVNNTSALEDSLIAMTGSIFAFKNYYCKTIKTRWGGKLKKGDKIEKIKEGIDSHGCESRYYSLNLDNLWNSKKTVEFRIFRGTLNANKVISYIIVAIGIAQKSAEQSRGSAFVKETGDNTTGQYYQDAQQKLECTLRRRPSKEHFGFSDEMWTLYSARVIHNTKWNANHLDKKLSS